MEPFPVATVAAFGLVVGSFLNVVIARLQREEKAERSVLGRSRCPQCGATIAWYDNIPVFSWLWLRARCRSCKCRIPARYPLVEILTAVLWAAVAVASDDWRTVAPGLVFMGILIPVTFIDLDVRRIPNALMYPGLAVGLALSIGLGPEPRFISHDRWWLEVLLATLGARSFLWIAWYMYPKGMGFGDVRLAAVMGAFLGAPVAVGMFVGFMLALVPSLALMARLGKGARKVAIPFGPFLCGGAVVGWFWGPQILDWYLNLGRS